MSSAFTPSSGAVAQAGGAVLEFAATAIGKLYDAEASTQYNNGQEILRRGVNDFMLKLQQDPDYQSYSDKWAKYEDQAWNDLDKIITNPDARNQLYQWWQQTRDGAEASVGKAALATQGNALLGTRAQNIDALLKDKTLSPAAKQQKFEEFTQPLVRSQIIDPATAEQQRQQFNYQSESVDLLNKAEMVARQQGIEAAQTFIADHGKDYPNLDETAVESVARTVTSNDTMRRAASNLKAKENNAGIENTIVDALAGNNLAGAMQILTDASPSGKGTKFQDIDGGASAADTWRQWHSYLHTFAQNELTSKRTFSQQDPVYLGYLADASNENIHPEVTFANARKDFMAGKLDVGQWKGIQAALSPRIKARTIAYEDQFKVDDTAAKRDPDLKARMGAAVGFFRTWAADNMDASDEEMGKKAKFYFDAAVNKTLNQNLATYNTITTEAISAVKAGTATIVPVKPGERYDPMTGKVVSTGTTIPRPLVDKLKASKVTVTGSQVSGGTTYYQGSDGKTYQVAKSGAVLWWDGKTWQTLK